MKLNFLGKGAAFFPEYGNTVAYMIEGENLFLLDCGTTTYELLHGNLDLNSFKEIYVLITHLHADHVGSLGSLISYCQCVLKKQIYVIHPIDTINQLLKMQGIDPSFYIYKTELPLNSSQIKAKEIEVFHATDMKCFAYLLEQGGEVIYYSGDANDISDEIVKGLCEGEIHKIYQDTSTHDVENPSHCYYGKLEKKIPLQYRDKVYCMHLDCECDEMLKEKGFRVVECVEFVNV